LETLKCFKGRRDYFYNKQLLIELYETTFGIHDHTTTNSPLASVRFNEAEDYFTGTNYEGYLSTFMYRDLGKKLNMSFDDFINRPRYEIETILKVAEDLDKKKLEMNQSAVNELEKTGSKMRSENK